jgi:hypothetical protein
MRFTNLFAAALVLGSASALSAMPAVSAPLISQPGLSSSVPSLATETIQYRRYGYRGRYGYGGYRHGYGGGAVLGGLAAGALIGGAIAAGSAAAANNNADYCAQRFRSYDPASGTYLANDGNRYACP